MDNMRNFDIDKLLKTVAAEENSTLNFDKWKAEILSTAQFLEPSTTKFVNTKSTRLYEFTRKHAAAIVASAAALIITVGISSSLLNRTNTAAPEAAMPQAARVEDIDEATPEILGAAPAEEYDNTAGNEPIVFSIPEETQDTSTGGNGENGETGSAGKNTGSGSEGITDDETVMPPKTDILPAQDSGETVVDPGSPQRVTDEVKKVAVDAIVAALTLNDINTNGYIYENAEIIIAQHSEYTYGPLVTSTQDAPPKTSGEYEGTIFVVSFTLPDWSVKQYVLSTVSYEVLGEVTFG